MFAIFIKQLVQNNTAQKIKLSESKEVFLNYCLPSRKKNNQLCTFEKIRTVQDRRKKYGDKSTQTSKK